jgi:hypothetical protein
MATESDAKDVQSFIFERELAEVYLLLDFLSGRPDKNLSTAFKGAGLPPIPVISDNQAGDLPPVGAAPAPEPPPGPAVSEDNRDMAGTQSWISAICQIRWPLENNRRPPAVQATTLLIAKDHLNNAAQPANGMSIAFSLLVAGDDEFKEERQARQRNFVMRLIGKPEEPLPLKSSSQVASRISLARQGYPNLIRTATMFRRWITVINIILVLWLALTCFLSWNVAIGHALVLRVDAAEAARIAIYKQIPAAAPGTAGTPAPSTATKVSTLCPAREFEELRTSEFDSPAHRRLCYELADNHFKYRVARENLADWLAFWRPLKKAAFWVCGGRCLEDAERVKSPTATNDQWAATLLEVLATAVLPLCYGFLGAGAAVVRGIWSKMRYSTLTPRDLRLAWSQLALGAVIGACIGLFITPGAGSAQEGAALFNGPVVLSASALSFIAGFGVEGVFQAMESLIQRIFNLKEAR